VRTPQPTPSVAAADPSSDWDSGWWLRAQHRPSPHFGPRPDGLPAPTLAVIHSISLPPGVYGGCEVEQLFLGQLDVSADPYFERLRGVRVSAHFFIRRDGACLQFVSCRERAWHAGQSSWRGRQGCNDFSVGIELEGLEGLPFEPGQYATLIDLLAAVAAPRPCMDVAGHEHIAPGRKADPGEAFDWPQLVARLGWPGHCFPPGIGLVA